MMSFLFIVLVVILNILIAQLSDTYADVKSDATRTLERNWAKALIAMEQADKFRVCAFCLINTLVSSPQTDPIVSSPLPSVPENQ